MTSDPVTSTPDPLLNPPPDQERSPRSWRSAVVERSTGDPSSSPEGVGEPKASETPAWSQQKSDRAPLQWREAAERDRDQIRQRRQASSLPDLSSDSEVSLSAEQTPQSHGWQRFQMTESERESRTAERRERMEAKTAKRKAKAEEARRSWSKRSGERSRRETRRDKAQPRPTSRSRSRGESKSRSVRETKEELSAESRSRLRSQSRSESHIPTAQSGFESSLESGFKSEAEQSAESQDSSRSSKAKKRRPKPPIDGAWVKRSGMYYLGRFSASEAHFRTVLMNKIRRAESRASEDPAEHARWVEAAVEEGKQFGGIDDTRLALGLARSSLRRGVGRSAARQKLRQKKLGDADVEAALSEIYEAQEGEVDPNLSAAARAAKKKRLGPWGPAGLDYPARSKQLAKLARRGFSYQIAQKVLNASLEEAEEWL